MLPLEGRDFWTPEELRAQGLARAAMPTPATPWGGSSTAPPAATTDFHPVAAPTARKQGQGVMLWRF